MDLRIITLSAALGLTAVPVQAEPFVPKHDRQVLLRLPSDAGSSPLVELRRRRARLSENPGDLPAALEFAQFAFELGRREGEPRYFGYAAGVLEPWWKQPIPPLETLLLRAGLEQHHHRWQQALADLDQVLRRRPRWPQAWRSRAVTLTVIGELDLALASCGPLEKLASPLVWIGCRSHVAGLGPDAEAAYGRLRQVFDQSPDADRGERIWALGTLAEIARRLGRNEDAEQHFRQALELDPRDIYLLSAYSDLLLDQQRPQEVLTLVEGENRRTSLLLRSALALKQLASPELPERVAVLERRYDSGRRRGERLHLGEEARLALHLGSRVVEALDLAEQNWRVQREPIDARILLQAALAAGRPEKAAGVVDHVRSTGLRDLYLDKLIAELAGASR